MSLCALLIRWHESFSRMVYYLSFVCLCITAHPVSFVEYLGIILFDKGFRILLLRVLFYMTNQHAVGPHNVKFLLLL